MKALIAFWNIVLKDMRAYYLKPPNISWGLIFPIAWTPMFFIKSGRGLEDVSSILPGVVAISILFGTTSMGLFIAVSVSEIFEAQTFSNFSRFPMIFLCGLFFPIDALPMLIRPLSYLLPLTYGVDILKGGFHGSNVLPLSFDFFGICLFCIVLFFFSLRNIHKKWIA